MRPARMVQFNTEADLMFRRSRKDAPSLDFGGKRKKTETESEEIDSPEVERLREDLLDGIDEDSDLCTSIHDLDSFMRSFEEEITTSPTSSHGSGAAEERIVESASDYGESGEVEEGIVELVSDSGESRSDLGYLLEASDDELEIPPPAASPARKELVTGSPIVTGFFTFSPEPKLPESGLCFELVDLIPSAFFIFDAASDVRDLCRLEFEPPLEVLLLGELAWPVLAM
ncbi:hypothetical protein SASPL_114931 [Salvia splendens]|uniref:Uncharacterized protein n=1 Tax=Salvia splendens TaxID=180675 RepID=A0A8X9A158_SALSN|nr:hypothetical protein SASPL_114931 [Salvia splendens]